MTHQEKAVMLLHQQYHCSQAVLGAFAEDFGLDLPTAFKFSACFGSGMRYSGRCGCMTGALLVLGMSLGFYEAQEQDLEEYGAQKTREFVQRFTERMHGETYCRSLEPDTIGQEGIPQTCLQAVSASIEILEDMLAEIPARTSCLCESLEPRSIIRRASELRRFQTRVNGLLHSTSKRIAFIQFDIRQFKIINDLHGEHFGDKILDFVVCQLEVLCRREQLFANLRSDVFMVVMEFDAPEEITELIHQLDERLQWFRNVRLQLSYGVYVVQDLGMEQRQMEDRAAMARKAAKQDILTNIAFYKEQFKESLYNRKFIEENMDKAIAERQIQMYLQPKYSIKQNRIVGAEALVRWVHPSRGMIYPDQFIPIVEENGLIQKIDYYIWEEACRFLGRCKAAGITNCPVSVNMSRCHLCSNSCVHVLTDLIERNGISKQLLELEITETAGGQIRKKAMQLKEEVFTLLMDDFGSGYSSLNILLETPFDVIKLDKKFMENIVTSRKGLLILEQVVAMANKLELGLLAEGVETKEQVDLLRSIGCDQVQGYYYAAPMPPDEFYHILVQQYNATA